MNAKLNERRDVGDRERGNYNIDEYFNKTFNYIKPPKVVKSNVRVFDFQFISDPVKLTALLKKEEMFKKKVK